MYMSEICSQDGVPLCSDNGELFSRNLYNSTLLQTCEAKCDADCDYISYTNDARITDIDARDLPGLVYPKMW